MEAATGMLQFHECVISFSSSPPSCSSPCPAESWTTTAACACGWAHSSRCRSPPCPPSPRPEVRTCSTEANIDEAAGEASTEILARALQASGRPVIRQAGGVATCGSTLGWRWHGTSPPGSSPASWCGVEQHPLVPLQRAAWEEN